MHRKRTSSRALSLAASRMWAEKHRTAISVGIAKIKPVSLESQGDSADSAFASKQNEDRRERADGRHVRRGAPLLMRRAEGVAALRNI